MANVDEVSIKLPASLVEKVSSLARAKNLAFGEVLREALCRYEEFDAFLDLLRQGGNQADAVDDYTMEYINRIVHETRAEMAAESAVSERRAS